MTSPWSRRRFLGPFGGAAAAAAVWPKDVRALGASPFKLAVLTDEIGQDFDHACSVASREFGMGLVELREVWNKNIMRLESKEIEEARRAHARGVDEALLDQHEPPAARGRRRPWVAGDVSSERAPSVPERRKRNIR
jgi:hypothetical protein